MNINFNQLSQLERRLLSVATKIGYPRRNHHEERWEIQDAANEIEAIFKDFNIDYHEITHNN